MTVAELGELAGLDNDEALLHLWDAGLDRYKDSRDRLRRRDTDLARRAVGLPSSNDLTNPEYWAGRLRLDPSGFRELLTELGSPMSSSARTIPRGAVAKLKKYSRHQLETSPQVESQRARNARPEPLVQEPFEWRVVGRQRRPLRLLTEEEVEAIHDELVREFALDDDPIDPPGVRSHGLLGSAVFRQYTSLGDESKYPTVEMASAALLHAIVHDHPFFNGNKRTALVAALVLLDENGVVPLCEEDELFELVLRLAQHRLVPRGRDLPDRETIEVADWIHARSRNAERGDRPIQWRKLRQILTGFDCEITAAPGVGNRLNIKRRVVERGLLGRPRSRFLNSQVKYADDGRQAMIDTVKKLRRDLWLDDAHGIDSLDFYQRGGPSASESIVRYRKTLKRLARL